MADEHQDATAAAAEPALNPDLMGYPTVEALVNAKRASDAEAKKILDRAQRAEQALVQYTQAQTYEPNARQAVKQRPQERLMEIGVPVDALDEYFGEKLQTAFQPLMAGINARSTVQARYPDYNKFEADVNQYIQSDPELVKTYNDMFSVNPVGAFEYAFLKFGQSRREGIRQTTEASDQGMVDASIPGGRNGESRRLPDKINSDVQKAWETYQKTGSTNAARDYARARLKTVITDDFLNA